MCYIPNTDAEREAMLARIGAKGVDDLFCDVPKDKRYPPLDLPEGVSEAEILADLQQLSEANADARHFPIFLGAGAYNHFIPSVVGHVIGRSEFYTAYTPYQPEISQGTLQTIFEYQSLVCELTGMEVANASHYDGGTAVGEAAIMAISLVKKPAKIVVSPALHPEYRQVLRTYTEGLDVQVVGDEDLTADLERLAKLIDQGTVCVLVQNPDFLGEYHDLTDISEKAHGAGALLVVVVDPISLGLFKAPGDFDADIVVGEGQSLGNPMSFGGPYLGLFACKEKYVRRMAGRLVGQTKDSRGQRGFVLTLQTREQHIRREKATSNICSNEALNALAACAYLSTLGKHGLRRVAELCYHKSHYAARAISEIPGFTLVSREPFFKEFVVRCPVEPRRINKALLRHGIIGGYELGKTHPHLADCMLFCVTEMNTKGEIDHLVEALKGVAK
ncbi:MAG: aminomethyl-transferring glycine dehydrogenase subunit GcvPA [Chloroflexi bacterium]|nr:aminomethyl-transferring glycine dehydrogenase subunit GcvPA [Chloroflexota bacterium]